MPRLFVGLELPLPIRQKLLQLQGGVTGARWQSAEQLHLTLYFIGEADEALASLVQASLRDLEQGAFEIALSGVGCFGRAQQPRALWAGVEPQLPLLELHQRISKRLAPVVPSRTALQPYRPHITLARFRSNAGPCQAFLEKHVSLKSAPFGVDEVCLFSSTPEAGGSRYQVQESFVLTP